MVSLLDNITPTKTAIRRMMDALAFDFSVPNYEFTEDQVNAGLSPYDGLRAGKLHRFDGSLEEALDFVSAHQAGGTIMLFGFTTEQPDAPFDAAQNGLRGRMPMMLTIARISRTQKATLQDAPWDLDDIQDAAMCSLTRPRRRPNLFGLENVIWRTSRHAGAENGFLARLLVFDATRLLRPA